MLRLKKFPCLKRKNKSKILMSTLMFLAEILIYHYDYTIDININ